MTCVLCTTGIDSPGGKNFNYVFDKNCSSRHDPSEKKVSRAEIIPSLLLRNDPCENDKFWSMGSDTPS